MMLLKDSTAQILGSEIYAKAIEMKFGEIVNTNNLRVAGMPDINMTSCKD